MINETAVVIAGLGPVGGVLAALLGGLLRGAAGTITAVRPDRFLPGVVPADGASSAA